MAFVDEVDVEVRAGRGGDGSAVDAKRALQAEGRARRRGRRPTVATSSSEVSRNVHDLAWLADHPHLRADPGKPRRRSRAADGAQRATIS